MVRPSWDFYWHWESIVDDQGRTIDVVAFNWDHKGRYTNPAEVMA